MREVWWIILLIVLITIVFSVAFFLIPAPPWGPPSGGVG